MSPVRRARRAGRARPAAAPAPPAAAAAAAAATADAPPAAAGTVLHRRPLHEGSLLQHSALSDLAVAAKEKVLDAQLHPLEQDDEIDGARPCRGTGWRKRARDEMR